MSHKNLSHTFNIFFIVQCKIGFTINLVDGGGDARSFCSFQRVIAVVGSRLADVPRNTTKVRSHGEHGLISLLSYYLCTHATSYQPDITDYMRREMWSSWDIEPSHTHVAQMFSYTELNETQMIFICKISLKIQRHWCVRAPDIECTDKYIYLCLM